MVFRPRHQDNPQLLRQLGVVTYQQRWPWIGGDLQTLRDTLRPVPLPVDQGEPVRIAVPALASGAAEAGELLACLDIPACTNLSLWIDARNEQNYPDCRMPLCLRLD